MNDHCSNQYPRLPWERDTEMVHGDFVARPHSAEGGWARVYYDRTQVSMDEGHEATYWWVWAAIWPERFGTSGYVACKSREEAKQQAADQATIAYWDATEATEGWKPAPKEVVSFDFMAFHFWMRVERWISLVADIEVYRAMWTLYRTAATTGPSVIAKEEDRQMAQRFTDRYWSVRMRLEHGQPSGSHGY